MKKLVFLGLIFYSIICHAQIYKEDFLYKEKSYVIKSSIQKEGDVQIQLKDENQKKVEFSLNPLNLEIFQVKFYNNFKELAKDLTVDKIRLDQISKLIFYNIIANNFEDKSDEGAVAGTLEIKDKVGLYENQSPKTNYKIKINEVEIEFYEGYIELIKVNGTVDKSTSSDDLRLPEKLVFSNLYSIGFSTRKNFKTLADIALYCKNCNNDDLLIRVGDLITYDYKIRSSAKDFSPGNQTSYLYGGKTKILRKAKRQKLINAVVFTDVQGYNEDNPNGILQTEFSKRINLLTHRVQISTKTALPKALGLFQYIQPQFIISKIEENEFSLAPTINDEIIQDSDGNDIYKPAISTSPTEILNYQNSSVGAKINLLLLEDSDLKYNLEANAGFYYSRTSVRDSLRTLNLETGIIEKTGIVNEFVLDYITVYPEVSLIFFPEEEFNLSISYKHLFFTQAFNEIDIITVDKNQIQEDDYTRGINILEMLVRLKVGKGYIFGRWRWNAQNENVRQNFQELQLGYSFDILK